MTSSQLPEMVPHTAAKHLLLKLYLDRWFPIMGRHNRRLNYIDGFAGPGEYRGGEDGSPIIAIESACTHVSKGSLPPSVTVNFIFVEKDLSSVAHLRERLSTLHYPRQFKIEVREGTFSETLEAILDNLGQGARSLAPTFAFVDPFGFSGIPFDLLTRILNYPKCEVFINVMVEFINRFLEHPSKEILEHFTETFGTDAVLDIPERSGDRLTDILTLYRKQLRTKARYVGRFDMRGRRDQKTYSLFFASNNPKGFEKIKEAMWSVDAMSGKQFSDAYAGQGQLFEAAGFEPLWDELLEEFLNCKVRMAAIDKFVIEETDYLPRHARAILKDRERMGDIAVEPITGYKRRRGTFKADSVDILFLK